MKWIKCTRDDDRVVYIRDDDIDYVVSYGKCTKIYQKNGKDQIVNTDDIENNLLLTTARPLPDYDTEIFNGEIWDLKLENDRLQKQNDLLIMFVKSASCDNCSDCLFKTSNPCGPHCAYLRGPDGANIIKGIARTTLNKLEEL